METVASFQDFRSQWLEEVVAGNPSTTELGHRFARKLITQWLDVFEDSDDLIYCDGAGDGGIDIAYLDRGENGDVDSLKGDIWYLVQSKYGAASQGKLLEEAQKVLDTLDGQRARLSSLSESLRARLVTFRGQASERDRIILVFATEKALNDSQKRAIESIKAMGFEDRASMQRALTKIAKVFKEEADRAGSEWKPPPSLDAMIDAFERSIAYRAAHPPVYVTPTCPKCGKNTTEGQLKRCGYCMRCLKEFQAPMKAWIDVWEKLFSLPMPVWRPFSEIKPREG